MPSERKTEGFSCNFRSLFSAQQCSFPSDSDSFQVFRQSFDVKHWMVAPHLFGVGRILKLSVHVVQNSFLSKCCLWSNAFAFRLCMQRIEKICQVFVIKLVLQFVFCVGVSGSSCHCIVPWSDRAGSVPWFLSNIHFDFGQRIGTNGGWISNWLFQMRHNFGFPKILTFDVKISTPRGLKIWRSLPTWLSRGHVELDELCCT